MSTRLRVLTGLLCAVAFVGGCTAASRVKQLQPPSVPSSPQITLPSQPAPFQRGVDIDAYTYAGQDIAAAATADVAYIKGLHANAVSISFPFFTTPYGVYTTSATPTPGQLSVVIRTAARAGLRVTIRPLLDEKNIHHCRCLWAPAHPRRWFGSYTRFLLPYAVAAQSAGAAELVVATELGKFAHSPHWPALAGVLGSVFHGKLACDSNWNKVSNFAGSCGLPASAQEVDAYPPMVGDVTAGWKVFDALQQRGIVESEVGIDGVAGASLQPYKHHWPSPVISQRAQARWFTAACRAAVAEHLGGIYFWPVGFGTNPGALPTPAFQGAWGGAGARAVSACFAQIDRSGK